MQVATGQGQLTWASDRQLTAGADAPTLFTAMQEQLGLRVVQTKAPMEVIVVDHIEKPSEN